MVEKLDSVPAEFTVAVSFTTIQTALLFRYVKVKGAVPFKPVVTVLGTVPAAELGGVSKLSTEPPKNIPPIQLLVDKSLGN